MIIMLKILLGIIGIMEILLYLLLMVRDIKSALNNQKLFSKLLNTQLNGIGD